MWITSDLESLVSQWAQISHGVRTTVRYSSSSYLSWSRNLQLHWDYPANQRCLVEKSSSIGPGYSDCFLSPFVWCRTWTKLPPDHLSREKALALHVLLVHLTNSIVEFFLLEYQEDASNIKNLVVFGKPSYISILFSPPAPLVYLVISTSHHMNLDRKRFHTCTNEARMESLNLWDDIYLIHHSSIFVPFLSKIIFVSSGSIVKCNAYIYIPQWVPINDTSRSNVKELNPKGTDHILSTNRN
jgi:hypothetical protein